MMKRKKLWNIEPHHAQELADAARVEQCGRVRSRMLALRHLLTGHAVDETAGLFVIGRSQLYHWLQRYRVEGLAGLRDRPRPGAPRHLKADDEQAFRQTLANCIAAQTASKGAFNAQAIRELLREKFNACYSISGVYMLLQRLGLSDQALHPKASAHAPAARAFAKKIKRTPSAKSP